MRNRKCVRCRESETERKAKAEAYLKSLLPLADGAKSFDSQALIWAAIRAATSWGTLSRLDLVGLTWMSWSDLFAVSMRVVAEEEANLHRRTKSIDQKSLWSIRCNLTQTFSVLLERKKIFSTTRVDEDSGKYRVSITMPSANSSVREKRKQERVSPSLVPFFTFSSSFWKSSKGQLTIEIWPPKLSRSNQKLLGIEKVVVLQTTCCFGKLETWERYFQAQAQAALRGRVLYKIILKAEE